jgi:hypothetical protein
MPKRRKRLRSDAAKKLNINKRKAAVFSAVILFLLFIVVSVRLLVVSVDNIFTVAIAKQNGDIELLLADFSSDDTITSVIIPSGVESSLAMQRGTLRAESIWKLKRSENLPGQILADSVMRTFYIPVDYWASEGAINNILALETDMPFVLRARVMLFSRSKMDKIDLGETSYLTSVRLNDGDLGYRINGTLPLVVSSLAADPRISNKQTAISIINKTGEPAYSLRSIVSVIEVLGGKVAPIYQDEEIFGGICSVRAVETGMRKRVANIFNCEETNGIPESFDIELTVGSKFIERF